MERSLLAASRLSGVGELLTAVELALRVNHFRPFLAFRAIAHCIDWGKS